jgi:hypothetical protein
MALVLALGVMFVIGMLVTTSMLYTTQNEQAASRSSFDMVSHSLAEAGINNAMSVLSNTANNALVSTTLPNSYETANVSSYGNGYVKWWGTLNSSTSTWTLNSIGYMRNPTGGADVTRHITMFSKVRPSFMQPANNPAWNYIFATRTGTPGGCDESLNNSVNIQSPLYVVGNLCMNTPSQVTGGPLVVNGYVKLDSNTNVGSGAAPVNEVHVRGGCSYKGGSFVAPCGPAQKVWAGVSDSNPPTLTPPQADFASWYANSSPGPHQACQQQSGTVPVFDNDASANNSVPGVFNLTPSTTDYSCVVRNASGAIVGQLSWDHNAQMLTIYGTIYIDGSASANYGYQNVAVQYQGQGTIYLGGTFNISNTKLCASIANGTCDFDHWDPNANMLVIVANGSGGQNPPGDSIQLVSSFFEGGLWATNAVELDTSSQSEGPMVGGNIILSNTVFARPWPLMSVPVGMPGSIVVYAQPDPPTGYSS